MDQNFIISTGLFVLALISGMLGLGVAFAAIPFLGLFLPDLVNQVQPLSLLLNGLTALFATFGFARSGYVDWKKAIILATVATSVAPIGAYLAHFIKPLYLWYVYFIAVTYLAYQLFRPVKEQRGKKFLLVVLCTIPIAFLSGLLGVGPGFLLMPALILLGFEPKKAAGINAFAVTPPSFSAVIPHLTSARFDTKLTLLLLFAGVIGAFLGARITSLYVPSKRIKQLFGILIVITTLYKIYTLLK